MIRRPVAELESAARRLRGQLRRIEGVTAAVVTEQSQVGGGSVPSVFLETRAVQVEAAGLSAAALAEKLRREHSIICRIVRDKVIFDMRTLLEGDDKKIAQALRAICEELA